MPAAKNIFPNLRAEMARKGITVQDIATTLQVNRSTACGKLTGKRPLHFDEAISIVDAFFPDEDVRHIFEKD